MNEEVKKMVDETNKTTTKFLIALATIVASLVVLVQVCLG